MHTSRIPSDFLSCSLQCLFHCSSNGENITLGRVALVRVANEQGLDKKGGTQWDSTQFSGDKIWGESNKGSFGSINNGTLEQSNIDMTQELVDLISAQRNFQANSRALEVHNQLQQNYALFFNNTQLSPSPILNAILIYIYIYRTIKTT